MGNSDWKREQIQFLCACVCVCLSYTEVLEKHKHVNSMQNSWRGIKHSSLARTYAPLTRNWLEARRSKPKMHAQRHPSKHDLPSTPMGWTRPQVGTQCEMARFLCKYQETVRNDFYQFAFHGYFNYGRGHAMRTAHATPTKSDLYSALIEASRNYTLQIMEVGTRPGDQVREGTQAKVMQLHVVDTQGEKICLAMYT